MERSSLQPKEISNGNDVHGPHNQQPRRNSLTPSMRRERPMLRSSPLAGPSYSADGAGNVVEHTSALEEEIARRRTALAGLTDEDLSRLANLPTSSPTPALSYSSSPNPSRKGSLETIDDPQAPRRARPSFISLGPQGSRPGSRDSLAPPTPTSPASPTLRARHSSPHLSVNVKPNPEPVSADWMTAAPAASFSRMGVHGSGVILPVKASSRAGERIRQRSTTNEPATVAAHPNSPPQTSTKPRSLKSFRSMSRLLRGNDMTEHGKEVHPMPTSLSIPGRRSHSSSFELGAPESRAPPSPASPITPNDSVDARTHGRFAPAIANPDVEPSPFSGDAGVTEVTGGPAKLEGNDRENRVKRLWTKVRKWRA